MLNFTPQYPFIRPTPGEWHSDWDETRLEPWKEVVRQLMRHHRDDPASQLATISTEFIPFPDYGGNAKYSIFEHSVACAAWLRETWATRSLLTSPAKRREGDRRPKSRWWRGRAPSAEPRTAGRSAEPEARPLHPALFAALGARSPSRRFAGVVKY